jgi:hypothetical protein
MPAQRTPSPERCLRRHKFLGYGRRQAVYLVASPGKRNRRERGTFQKVPFILEICSSLRSALLPCSYGLECGITAPADRARSLGSFASLAAHLVFGIVDWRLATQT